MDGTWIWRIQPWSQVIEIKNSLYKSTNVFCSIIKDSSCDFLESSASRQYNYNTHTTKTNTPDSTPVELDSETEVGNAAGTVLLDQDVLALQVSVGDGGLSLRAVDLSVQVAEAAGGRVGKSQQGLRVQCGQLQVVVQRAVLMVVGDKEELREGAGTFNVSCDEACRRERGLIHSSGLHWWAAQTETEGKPEQEGSDSCSKDLTKHHWGRNRASTASSSHWPQRICNQVLKLTM